MHSWSKKGKCYNEFKLEKIRIWFWFILENLRQKNNFIESNARRTFTNAFSMQQLVDLKKRYKYFRLLKVDEFVFENPLLQQRWSKKDIYAYKLHSCLVWKTGGFSEFEKPIFSKWFIKENDPDMFNVT